MPTFGQEITNNQIIISAGVSNPGQKSGKTYSAIVDTGAQMTMVSAGAIKENGLKPVGHIPVMGITGPDIVTKYKARVDIPVSVTNNSVMASGREMEVVAMPQDLGEFDVLLGMDFLSAFHITMHGSIFILSI